MKRKSGITKILTLTFSLLILVSLSFAGETIKIGVAGAISGDLAPYGMSSMRACEIAVEEINAKGGILGKKVELLIVDDVCKPEVAVNVASKLVSDGAEMVVGHICSGATLAANKIYRDAKILLISPASTNDALTFSGENPNFLRTISYDGAQADLMADFVVNTLKKTKIALIHDKGDYGKGQMELVKKNLEKIPGIEVVLFEGVTTGAVDYTAIVQKIKRKRAEVTMWGGYHSDASKIATLLKKKRVKTILFGGDGIMGTNFVNLAGKRAEGVYATGPNDTSSNPQYIALTKKHQEKYGEAPGTFFYSGYAAIQAFFGAIEKSGSTDYDKVMKALKSSKVDTPIGTISFDKRGDVVGAGFSVYKVIDGVYKQVN